MKLLDTLLARLSPAPTITPYGQPGEAAGWEQDGSHGSPMNVGDWLAVHRQTAPLPGHHSSLH